MVLGPPPPAESPRPICLHLTIKSFGNNYTSPPWVYRLGCAPKTNLITPLFYPCKIITPDQLGATGYGAPPTPTAQVVNILEAFKKEV